MIQINLAETATLIKCDFEWNKYEQIYLLSIYNMWG